MEVKAAVVDKATDREPTTEILLTIDESPCSQAVGGSGVKQFPPEHSERRLPCTDLWQVSNPPDS